jgi:hypothetical protein
MIVEHDTLLERRSQHLTQKQNHVLQGRSKHRHAQHDIVSQLRRHASIVGRRKSVFERSAHLQPDVRAHALERAAHVDEPVS